MGGLEIANNIAGQYSEFLSAFSDPIQKGINLFFLILIVFIYAIFVWKFHRFISRKNFFDLNLSQYNTFKHPTEAKFFAVILYVLEYIVLLPLMIFIWFSIFTIFLLLMSDNIPVSEVIVISAVVVGAIRFVSFVPRYGPKLAQDIAKLFPLTLLAVAMTRSGFFNFEKILGQISEVPSLLSHIGLYLLFIVIFEIFLRFMSFLLGFLGMKDEDDEEDED